MNNNKPKTSMKSYLILAAVIVIVIIAYMYLKPASDSGTATLDQNQFAADQAVGTRVLSLLNQISALRIDVSFFKDPIYMSLRDHTVPIPEESVGRDNPFAPIPGVTAPGTLPAQTNTAPGR
jgi:hypothetical protein